jgi:hypothetical protein
MAQGTAMAVAQEPRRGKPFRRLFGFVLFLAVLWCGAWAAAYWGANWAVDQAEALTSPQSRCTERNVGGFPLTIELGCQEASVEERFLGVVANITGLSASVPLYYPLRVDARATGPLRLSLPDERVSVVANWERASTSTEAWPFGQPGIRRFSAEVENLAIGTEGDVPVPINGLRADRGSIAFRPGSGADSLAVTVAAAGLDLQALAGRPLPPAALRSTVEAVGFGGMLTANAREQFLTWLAAGGILRLEELLIEVGGVKITANGPLQVGPDGLVSGTVQLGFAGLEQLPALLEALDMGSPEERTQLVGVLNAFTGEREVDGEKMRVVEATLVNGQIRIGFIPLPMAIPSVFSLAMPFA